MVGHVRDDSQTGIRLDSARFRRALGAPFFGAFPMTRLMLFVLAVSILAGCAGDPREARRGHPPQDPADYHGVPTDMTPPSMLDASPAPAGAAAQ